MKPRNISYILASMLALFTATKWRGLAYWQKFAFVAVLYCVVGVWLFRIGYFMVWVIGLVLLIALPFIYVIGDFFKLWSKKKN